MQKFLKWLVKWIQQFIKREPVAIATPKLPLVKLTYNLTTHSHDDKIVEESSPERENNEIPELLFTFCEWITSHSLNSIDFNDGTGAGLKRLGLRNSKDWMSLNPITNEWLMNFGIYDDVESNTVYYQYNLNNLPSIDAFITEAITKTANRVYDSMMGNMTKYISEMKKTDVEVTKG